MAPSTKLVIFEYATDIFYSVDKDCMKQELVTITTAHVEGELPKESDGNLTITTNIQVENNGKRNYLFYFLVFLNHLSFILLVKTSKKRRDTTMQLLQSQ